VSDESDNLMEDVGLPTGAKPDPDHPDWFSWGDFPRSSFAAATGRLLFKPDGPGHGITRMFPTEAHMNMGGSIHGGAVMSFIDMSLFAGGRCAGMAEGHYVTLDCHTRFVARGRVGVPLDAHVRLLKQTKGGLVFFEGHCEQDGEICYAFTGTLKRVNRPNGPSRDEDGAGK
jgi:acyl-coenzyme A thioesterase PaaI-like protein